MKPFQLIFALIAVVLIAASISAEFELNFGWTSVGIALLSMLTPMVSGALFMGLNQKIWSDIIVQQFRIVEQGNFLNEIPDESRWVSSTKGENEVISLTDIGADPGVLVNNTTYPLPIVSQVDGEITISLNKFQTEATSITEDETKYISYDKVGIVTQKHRDTVMEVKHGMALHALTPQTNTVNTPILVTTGPDDGTGRKMMVMKDIVSFKRKIDKLKIPGVGRVLVLCPDHYNDLLVEANDKPIFSGGSVANPETGLLSAQLHGFKVYWYVDAPYIEPTTLIKLSYGSVPTTHHQASVFFWKKDMFKAIGSTTAYTDPARPLYQRILFNIRHYYVVLPKKQRSIGAIVSANV